MISRISVLILSFFLLSFQPVLLKGKVIKVLDGDTIDILTSEKEIIRVRFNGIDAPEKKQAFGDKARSFTESYAAGKDVTIRVADTDRYGRTIGDVIIPGQLLTLNQLLVKSGYAWHYKKYSKDAVLAEYENSARKNKLGLWADQNPIAPWDFRKQQ